MTHTIDWREDGVATVRWCGGKYLFEAALVLEAGETKPCPMCGKELHYDPKTKKVVEGGFPKVPNRIGGQMNVREEWKAVLGFEGSYEVSNLGRVRSLPGKWRGKGKILSLCTLRAGYHVVQLSKNGHAVTRWVHRLVLDAFVGPRPEGMEGSHLDGNAGNNVLNNLRWESKTDNERRRAEHGRTQRGARSPNAKLTNENVLEMRRRHASGESYYDMAHDFGVHRTTVMRAVMGVGGWGEFLECS